MLNELPISYIMSNLAYEPEMGTLRWNRTSKGWVAKGRIAGSVYRDKQGKAYIRVRLKGRDYLAHRLIYAMVTGKWPEELIDHKNGCGTDNRWCNLRLATHADNHKNVRLRKDNISGHIGITASNGRYKARVRLQGRTILCKTFDLIEEAISARNEAYREHGFFPEHGSKRAI